MEANMESFIQYTFPEERNENRLKGFQYEQVTLASVFPEKNIGKPLRGLGRYHQILKVEDDSNIEAIRLRNVGTIKGYGRISTFYPELAQYFTKSKSEQTKKETKTYNYWRGLKWN